MTLETFSALNNAEQCLTLRRSGVLLAKGLFFSSSIYLYALSSFYIELFNNPDEPENSPLRILRAFNEVTELEDYLQDIDISSLTVR